ncbi:hypothetical protein FisN_15Lh005 [Fistulifera solaris]|uniref:CCR4-NOT transcription complex subunit 10 n=1 Tax=Fistulifera solaris TaxID=1519565 RepID=A0A1Z5KH95_FISSO|nr:hypothetical protein FisN_15Lh005 [Fistulifera solaris]|eukprot:GAX25639.1 hypothetical protein FisN_15Lh005 [Fistulifera solaris]
MHTNIRSPFCLAMMKVTPSARTSSLKPPRARYQQKLQPNELDVESLNNRAIAFLRTYQTKEAMQCLQRGLGVIQEMMRSREDVSTHSDCSIISQSTPIVDEREFGVVSPNGVFVFFQRAMQFSKRASPNVCAAVLLYNLALLHHHQAIRLNSSVLYRKTLQLYQLCQGTLPLSEIMQFAIMNNMGHIYSHLYIETAAQVCQDWLIYNRARLLPLIHSMAEEFVLLEPQRSCAAAMA